MRLFFSFGYSFKHMGIGASIQEEIKYDLVGYGYDIAPTLLSLKIVLLFFKFEAGNLFMNND